MRALLLLTCLLATAAGAQTEPTNSSPDEPEWARPPPSTGPAESAGSRAQRYSRFSAGPAGPAIAVSEVLLGIAGGAILGNAFDAEGQTNNLYTVAMLGGLTLGTGGILYQYYFPVQRRESVLATTASLAGLAGGIAYANNDLPGALENYRRDASICELLLQQGDWMRGLPDYEARLEIAGECYAPDLPRWQGEPVERLLIYPEQADIESDAAMRDTLMLARGVEAVVQCGATLADWLDGPTVRRDGSLDGFTAAAPLRSLPYLLNWSPDSPPPAPPLRRQSESREPGVGDDTWQMHLAARQGIATTIRLPAKADWLWGPRRSGPSPWYANVILEAV